MTNRKMQFRTRYAREDSDWSEWVIVPYSEQDVVAIREAMKLTYAELIETRLPNGVINQWRFAPTNKVYNIYKIEHPDAHPVKVNQLPYHEGRSIGIGIHGNSQIVWVASGSYVIKVEDEEVTD